MKKSVAILISMLMVVVGAFGLTACSGDDNLYIEVKHPITGEWVCSGTNWKSVTWDLPYTGEAYPLEVRYKYHGSIVDPEKEHLAVRGNTMKVTPSGIGCYDIKYFVEKPAKELNSTTLTVHLDIYGEFNIENNLKVELSKEEIDRTSISFYNNTTKHYKFTVPESGTYRFETVDLDILRLKYLSISGIKNGTQNEHDNNIFLEVDLEANKEYTLSTGIKEEYLRYLTGYSCFEICTTRVA